MTESKKTTLTATRLRIILSLTLLLIIAAGGGGFVYVKGLLTQYSVTVSHTKVDAQASDGNITSLETIQKELATDQDVVQKATQLRSTSEFPEFDIVNDVKKYAAADGISIDSYDFTSQGSTGTPSTTSVPAPAVSSSSKTVDLSVSIHSPVNYQKLLQFLYDLQQGLPKMQVQGVSVGPGDSVDTVEVQPITIEMYTE